MVMPTSNTKIIAFTERQISHLNLLSVAFPLANTFTLAAWGDSCIRNEIVVKFYNS